MLSQFSHSYAYCERLARREAGNFYHAFRILSRPQRRAMCALYSFLRVTDDLTDGAESAATKQVHLSSWRDQLNLALAGRYSHPLHPAFHHAVRTYAIPREYLDAVLDGVGMDLTERVYASFSDLYAYCYRVASVVGLACIHIWGFTSEQAKVPAVQAGIAFQLTNILRDLAEDAARDRVYLPREDLERFGYSVEQLRRQERDDRFRALMKFQVERARGYYDAAMPLTHYLTPPGRAVYQVMLRTYRGLLDVIEQRDYDVYTRRVSLGAWHKLGLALQALPVRWGWA
jgi:phytoene synthase